MKNFTFKSIFTFLALMIAMTSYSQDRTCGMVEYMEEMLKDPVLAKEYEENQKKFKAEVARRLSTDFQARGGATIRIPVAVHFPSGNPADRVCLEALAQSQIDVLNADYSATNSDLVLWNAASSNYPGLAPGSANIEFCLATSNHPAAVPQLIEGQPAVTIGYNFANGAGFPEMDVNFQGYMNFLVKDIGGILGYSPGGGSIANGMAVVINTNTFGVGAGCAASGIVPQAPYNQGRTTTHELGHFYTLNHPWGPGAPSCAADDGFADTPNTGQETYGCPVPGSQTSCGNTVLHMNYMDYVNDACMYMFTPQQMNAAEAYITAVLQPTFKPNTCQAVVGFGITADNDSVSSCPTTDTSVDFTFSFTTTGGFNENTTFSASGLPANATVNFSPSSLNGDGDFTMTVGNIGATAQGTYTITVTGTSNSVTESTDVTLNNNCTQIVCADYSPDPADLPLAITDGLAGGGIGQPIAIATVDIANTVIIESMTVTVDLTHTYIQDLILQLVHPDSTPENPLFINLLAQDCTSENLSNTVFTFEDGAPAITCTGNTGDVIANGTYSPSGDPLSTFNGLDAQGTWQLFVADGFAGDTGDLNALTLNICAEEPLSVNEFELENFAIFPNPNNGEFTIKLNSNSGNDIEVDVFDIRGRKIFKNAFTNTGEFNETINLNSVQSGMYLVTVNDGTNKVTKRIIVE